MAWAYLFLACQLDLHDQDTETSPCETKPQERDLSTNADNQKKYATRRNIA